MRSVPIVLIERSRLVREGLEKILSGTMFRVAATAPTPGDLRATLPADLRGLMIILGVGDDDHSPAEEIEALRHRFADSRIVILADHYELAPLAEALRLSVNGYLSKSISSQALIKALELVALGEGIFPSSILAQLGGSREMPAQLLLEAPEERPLRQWASVLSDRETQILRGLIEGQSNKTIARAFDIMEATVKVHVKAILRKIGVQNRTQAAIWALGHLSQSAYAAMPTGDDPLPSGPNGFGRHAPGKPNGH